MSKICDKMDTYWTLTYQSDYAILKFEFFKPFPTLATAI